MFVWPLEALLLAYVVVSHDWVVFFFFFFWGYRGIVHPPSDDEGTERTWFEPEHDWV